MGDVLPGYLIETAGEPDLAEGEIKFGLLPPFPDSKLSIACGFIELNDSMLNKAGFMFMFLWPTADGGG